MNIEKALKGHTAWLKSDSGLQMWIHNLTSEKDALKVYLLAKLETEDYHAVQDAASDMRDIQSQLDVMKKLLGPPSE